MSDTSQNSSAITSPWGLEHEVFLKLVKLVNEYVYQVEVLLKDQGLGSAHYNILRILRGAKVSGLTCSAIAERLLVKSPDITRLLDRLENQGLIVRERSKLDRRVVTASISEQGLELLFLLDEPMKHLHKTQFSCLEQRKLEQLSALLNDLNQIQES